MVVKQNTQFRKMGQKVAEEASGTLENLALLLGGRPNPDGSHGSAVGWDGNHVQRS